MADSHDPEEIRFTGDSLPETGDPLLFDLLQILAKMDGQKMRLMTDLQRRFWMEVCARAQVALQCLDEELSREQSGPENVPCDGGGPQKCPTATVHEQEGHQSALGGRFQTPR